MDQLSLDVKEWVDGNLHVDSDPWTNHREAYNNRSQDKAMDKGGHSYDPDVGGIDPSCIYDAYIRYFEGDPNTEAVLSNL